ncbi:MAG: hypothetical protein AAB071_05540 [Bacteroidota bacterium]
MYSYLIFISTMVLTVIFAAIFGAGNPQTIVDGNNGNGNGNGNGHTHKDENASSGLMPNVAPAPLAGNAVLK